MVNYKSILFKLQELPHCKRTDNLSVQVIFCLMRMISPGWLMTASWITTLGSYVWPRKRHRQHNFRHPPDPQHITASCRSLVVALFCGSLTLMRCLVMFVYMLLNTELMVPHLKTKGEEVCECPGWDPKGAGGKPASIHIFLIPRHFFPFSSKWYSCAMLVPQ